MKDIAFVFGVFALWFVLARWVLPALGVNTCMSGSCTVRCPSCEQDAINAGDQHTDESKGNSP